MSQREVDLIRSENPWGHEPRKNPRAALPWKQIAIITLVSVALYVFVRRLPIASNLNHMDFRTEGKGAIEFCDPSNPQFIPVVAVRSPVQLELVGDRASAINQPVTFTLKMSTSAGKPIGPADLLVAHTRKLHLLVVDPTLNDYQHIHPEPGRRNGEWEFTMTPTRPGTYRVFADFTPAATARGLYASADFEVPGTVPNVIRSSNTRWQGGGYVFNLNTPSLIRAGEVTDLKFTIESQGTEKRPVVLEPIMDAFAHLVAFDEARSGFAHLHPNETDLSVPPDSLRPELNFKVTIPQTGRYVIWAQVKIAGRETFVPFWIDVLP
jgi:hypothetical protein